jgi:hypothetical protein
MNQRHQAGEHSRGKDSGNKADVTDLLMAQRHKRGGIQRRGNSPASKLEGSRKTTHRHVPEKANGPPVAGH